VLTLNRDSSAPALIARSLRRTLELVPQGGERPIPAAGRHEVNKAIRLGRKYRDLPSYRELSARLHQPDVQLAELLRRDLRRRAHHQIFGALIHREQHHFAQVLLAA